MSQLHQNQLKQQERARKINFVFPVILLFLFIFLFAKTVKSQTIYVNSSAIGANDGSTWANAYLSLQTAIENATAGRQIWVAQGTYKPSAYPIGTTDGSSTRDYTFTLRNNVQIFGGFVATSGTEGNFGLRNFEANPTILSGDIGVLGDASDNCYHVVLGDYINGTAILDGFTIRDGNANASLITTHTPSGHILPSHSGAGMFLNFASPNINNCIITNNEATFAGGGVVAQGRSDEVFTNCVFANNRILTATFGGAGLYNYAHPSNPSYPTVTNCVFYNNISLGAGGAIYTQYSNMTITNTTIYNNTAQLWGGGIYNEDSSSMLIKNCIIWGNVGNAVSQPSGSDAGLTWNAVEPTVSFSLLQSPSTYSSNISANPLFINTSNPVGADGRWITADDGLRLSACSPAIDAGTNSGVVMPLDIAALIRPQGAGVDMGAYETLPTGLFGTTRLYVDAGNALNGIGNSWATAMNNLETALSTARINTCIREIWVKQGTYKPSHQYSVQTGNDTTANARYQTFNIPSGVAVYGGFIGTETIVSSRPNPLLASVLSGDIGVIDDSLDNSYHVVMFKNVLPTTTLDGFTITKGNANFDGIGGTTTGGGIFNECLGAGNSSNPTINNCTIINNNALRFGAGMYSVGAGFGICNPQIINCIVNNNNLSATYLGGSDGGGLYFEENTNGTCNPTITGCTISNNFANYGGAINFSNNTQATISNCNFLNNTARSGGAVKCKGQITINAVAFANCIFSNNIATSNGGAFYNVAYSGQQNPSFTNCTFNNNIAINGGALYNEARQNGTCNLQIDDCKFLSNNAAVYGGAIYAAGTLTGSCNAVITKSKFLNNSALYGGAVFMSQDSAYTAISTCIQCIFDNNTADYGAGFMAIATTISTINTAFSNCVFTRNNCVQSGGAVYLEARDNSNIHPNFEYCTFYNNHNSYGFAGIFNTREVTSNNNPIYTNCIINQTAITNVVAGSSTSVTPTFEYSNVEGSGGSSAWVASFGLNGGGNIDANPLFANTADLDGVDNNWATNDDGLRLQSTSPCINTGSNSLATATVDIFDNSRSIGTIVDMGAYEMPLAITYSFSASAGIGGSITPSGVISVAAGSNQTYTITSNTGFCINDVVVDGTSVGAVSTYTFTSVAASHSIVASFVANVTPTATIVSSQNLICVGSSLTITATPTNGGSAPMYNFYVDGVARGATTSNSFSISTLTVGSHNIYCVMTANNICQTTATATSNVKLINVGSPTILPNITGVTSSCVIGFTTRLYNAIGGGLWSSSNPSVATINSLGIVTTVANGVCGITYTYTNSFGCVSITSINYTVALIGTINQIVGSSDVCVGSSITLSNSTTGGVWSSIAGRATVVASGVVTGTSAGVATIRYTVSNAFGCSAYVAKNVTVNAIPAIPTIAYAPGTVSPQCGVDLRLGRTFGLVGTPTGGTWSSSNSAVININPTTGITSTGGIGTATVGYSIRGINGCSSSRNITRNVVVCSSRGIAQTNEISTANFIVYPNPAKNIINIKSNSILTEGKIIMTDLLGKTILQQALSIDYNTIDVSRLAKGMYLINIVTSNTNQIQKIIVE